MLPTSARITTATWRRSIATGRRVFVDTSALYAFLDRSDKNHESATRVMAELLADRTRLVASSYVAHETIALVHRRFGVEAVRRWKTLAEPLLEIVWIEQELHTRALAALLAAGKRDVSLTDWSSFEAMRSEEIRRVFAFDPDFDLQGFQTIP